MRINVAIYNLFAILDNLVFVNSGPVGQTYIVCLLLLIQV